MVERDDPNQNILKTRDDPRPVFLTTTSGPSDLAPKFQLAEATDARWVKVGESFGPELLRGRIEPWLTALCQSEHLSILLGSGLSNGVHSLATGKPFAVSSSIDFGDFDDLLIAAAKHSAESVGRSTANIEDSIRVANEMIRGLQIQGLMDEAAAEQAQNLQASLARGLNQFASSILLGEQEVIEAKEEDRETAFNYLVSFLMTFASRSGTRDRLNIFTTNYDRFVEAGAEAAGLHLLDRFVGSIAPVFRSSRLDLDIHYNPPGIRGEPRYLEGVARFTKLHGSVDWLDRGGMIQRAGVPYGMRDLGAFLRLYGLENSDVLKLMVYPNAAKDQETAVYPYVELFRDFAASICRPNHTLFVFGYGFGDEHINRVVEDMLTIPSTQLVIIAYDDPFDRIMTLYEKLGRHAQVSLLLGHHVGSFQSVVDNYLPKPAIDRATFRMAELLRVRWGAGKVATQSFHDATTGEHEGPSDGPFGESGK